MRHQGRNSQKNRKKTKGTSKKLCAGRGRRGKEKKLGNETKLWNKVSKGLKRRKQKRGEGESTKETEQRSDENKGEEFEGESCYGEIAGEEPGKEQKWRKEQT